MTEQGVAGFRVTIALMGDPNRPAELAVPSDLTELEALNLIAQVLALADHLRSERKKSEPRSRLYVPKN